MPSVMIIDDDPHLSTIYADALRFSGFEVEQVLRSATALALIHANKPDMIILDLEMPQVSGLELLAAIQAEADLRAMKVLVVTANSRAEDDATISTRADLVLIKPVSIHEVIGFATRLTHGL